MARYHRRGTPKQSHDEYASLSPKLRRTVRMLASILRVAESLDRSHSQVVSGLALQDRGNDVLLHLQVQGDAELEMWATDRHLRPFEKLLGKSVRLETAPGPAKAGQPGATPRRA